MYQADWADNKDFDQVLISKRMIQDHMPDNVLDALEKVLFNSSESEVPQIKTGDSLPDISTSRDISTNHSEKPPVKLLESDLDFSPLEEATQFSSLAHLNNLISHDSLETESESIPRHNKDTDTTAGEEEMQRNSFYIDSEQAPLASPEMISESASLCSRNSIYSREYKALHAKLDFDNNMVNEGETIVVKNDINDCDETERILQEPSLKSASSDHSKRVKFKLVEDSKVVTNPSPHISRRISIPKHFHVNFPSS